MESTYVVFLAPGQVAVRTERVGPPGPGEVLCEATRSLVSTGTETYCLRGVFEAGTNWERWVKYPFRPGYSMVGRVVAVGQAVAGLKEGDRITSLTPHQQFFTVPSRDAHPIPDAVSDEDATWTQLAGTTQLGVRRATLALGESVGVIGLGILGQLVVQFCGLSGARRVVAIDPAKTRLAAAQAHGATHVLAMEAQRAGEDVARITDGKMLDVVFDVTGHPDVLSAAVRLLRRLGRVVLLGDTPTPSQQHLGPGVLSNSIAILGIHGSAHPVTSTDFAPWSRPEMAGLFFDYVAARRMRFGDLITHRVSPLQAPAVYDQLTRNRSDALGVVFDWTVL